VPEQTSVERRQQLHRAADPEAQLLYEVREHPSILPYTDRVADAAIGPTGQSVTWSRSILGAADAVESAVTAPVVPTRSAIQCARRPVPHRTSRMRALR
jgi:hypothetical protein